MSTIGSSTVRRTATPQTPSTQGTAAAPAQTATTAADGFGASPRTASQQCAVGASQDRPLPSQQQATADIQKNVMPQVMADMKADGQSVNASNCDHAAGRALARLRAAGYQAELQDAGSHVTVRVKTKEGDVIVDPTASQFFKDGTGVDGKLQKEGFVGNRQQLNALFADNASNVKAPGVTAGDLARETPGVDQADLQAVASENLNFFVENNYGQAVAPQHAALADNAQKECERQLLRGRVQSWR